MQAYEIEQQLTSIKETLLAMRRAGADIIITYSACDAARWLKQG